MGKIMTALTETEAQAVRKKLEAARDKALKDLDTVVKTERNGIWNDYFKGLDMIGLDKSGKPKKVQ